MSIDSLLAVRSLVKQAKKGVVSPHRVSELLHDQMGIKLPAVFGPIVADLLNKHAGAVNVDSVNDRLSIVADVYDFARTTKAKGVRGMQIRDLFSAFGYDAESDTCEKIASAVRRYAIGGQSLFEFVSMSPQLAGLLSGGEPADTNFVQSTCPHCLCEAIADASLVGEPVRCEFCGDIYIMKEHQ